jgi:hypothetical protein
MTLAQIQITASRVEEGAGSLFLGTEQVHIVTVSRAKCITTGGGEHDITLAEAEHHPSSGRRSAL